MLLTPLTTETIYTILHLFCGLGGGARGFQAARAQHLGLRGKFRTLCGVDNDADACADFRKITGAPATVADIAKMMPEELRRATRYESPDVVFLSPPCKGFSGLLPKARAAQEKYQALNRLVYQGLFLVLETWPTNLPGLIVIENVPGIRQRGAELLMNVKGLLGRVGYRFHESTHDCGEIGGLSQKRKRYLMVARLPSRVPTYVYQPPKRKVRSIGAAIGPMPMPDDPAGGPMHKLPRLEWRTWERLAFIPAGGDWRDLNEASDAFRGVLGVVPWGEPMGVVTGNGRPGTGTFSVADPRPEPGENGPRFNNVYRVTRWQEPAGAVTAGTGPSSSGVCVGDPRLSEAEGRHHAKFRVERWERPAHVVTGSDRIGSGAPSVGDPRWKPRFNNNNQVGAWDEPSAAVTGATRPNQGAISVADPRAFANHYRVSDWERPAPTVTSAQVVVAGALVTNDPRIGNWADKPGLMGVAKWEEPSPTINSTMKVSGGNSVASVADPRPTRRNGTLGVGAWDEPSSTVTGEAYPTTGTFSVADPRIPNPDDRPARAPLIIALDGTWHRPLTTLELARLQDLPVFDRKGRPLVLTGKSQARWRERIGNAVPCATAKAMGDAFLGALLGAGAKAGVGFSLSSGDVWVRKPALEREERRRAEA